MSKRQDPDDIVEMKMIRLQLMAVVVHGMLCHGDHVDLSGHDDDTEFFVGAARDYVDAMLKSEGLA